MEESNPQDHHYLHWAVEVPDGTREDGARLVEYQARGEAAVKAAVNGSLKLFKRDVEDRPDGSTTYGAWAEVSLVEAANLVSGAADRAVGGGPWVRQARIRDLLAAAGADGMSAAALVGRLVDEGLVRRRQTVFEDLVTMRVAGDVEQRGPGINWVLVADRRAESGGKVVRAAVVDRIRELKLHTSSGDDVENPHLTRELGLLERFVDALDRGGPASTIDPDDGKWGDGDRRTVDDMPEQPDFRPDEGEGAPRTGVFRETGDGGQVLEMPWMVCQSEGGPYDDDAFAAGVVAGQITEMLAVARQLGATMTRAMLIPKEMAGQVDLIAMRFGFRVLSAPAWDDPEYDSGWVRFTAEPLPGGDDGDDLYDDGDSG